MLSIPTDVMRPASGRFLGWRDRAAVLPASQKDGGECTQTPRRIALWSDDDASNDSDGFDLAKWRAECRAGLLPTNGVVAYPRSKANGAYSARGAVALPGISNKRQCVTETETPAPLSGRRTSSDVQRSEVALSAFEPAMLYVCRGAMPTMQRAREDHLAERALAVRACASECSKGERQAARKWRYRAEKNRSALMSVEPDPRDHPIDNAEESEEPTHRARRVQTILSRLKRAERNSTSYVPDEFDAYEGTEPNYAKRATVIDKKVCLGNLQERRREARRSARRKDNRRAYIKDLPEVERNALQTAFDMCSDGAGVTTLNSLHEFISEAGLKGNVREERLLVEQISWDYFTAYQANRSHLPNPRRGSLQSPPEEPESQVAISGGDPSSSSSVGVSFEDLAAEFVPILRREMSELRVNEHWQQFTSMLDKATSVTIFVKQFLDLAQSFGLDAASSQEVVASIPADDDDSPPSLVDVDGDRRLNFDAVHTALVQLGEQSRLARRRRERDIATAMELPEELAAKHQGDLLRLHESYKDYDVDSSGYLSHTEAKQLLKHLGLQPYKQKITTRVDTFLQESDTDGNGEIDFKEFLQLIAFVRKSEITFRRQEVRREFDKYLIEKSQLIDYTDVEAVLLSVGFMRALTCERKSSKTMAKRVADAFFDSHTVTSSTVNFATLEELCQRLAERACGAANDRDVQVGHSLGFDKKNLASFQCAFDLHDENGDGVLDVGEFERALSELMGHKITASDLQDIRRRLNTESDSRIHFADYLQLMKILGLNDVNISRAPPFTLKLVNVESLRTVLKLFGMSDSYVLGMEFQELAAMVASFLGVPPDHNLAAPSQARIVRNTRQLLEWAREMNMKTMGRNGPRD